MLDVQPQPSHTLAPLTSDREMPALSRGAVRKLLAAVLPADSDLNALCVDYFPETFGSFTHGMERSQKVDLLFMRATPGQIIWSLRQHAPERAASCERALFANPRAEQARTNPYRGLSAFMAKDAHLFYGREELTEKLWQRYHTMNETVGARRLLSILGPSGSGKSSVARAGLVPALRFRPLPGAESLAVMLLKPGDHPLESMAREMLRLLGQEAIDIDKIRALRQTLSSSNPTGEYDGLRLWAAGFASTEDKPVSLLVLVDQFEEVYTLCKDERERAIFVELLLQAADDPARHASVVLTLRSDFLGETQRWHPELNRAIGARQELVSAMSRDELRRAIAEPALVSGRPLDESLVELLLAESYGCEGALPLLEFALMHIWDGAEDGKAPTATLKELGGVGGALARQAQALYDQLSLSEQRIARRALLRMLHFGEGSRDTRRRVPLSELLGQRDTPEQVLAVLRQLASERLRLVTLSAAADSGDGSFTTVIAEVTHEALFQHWNTLRTWVEDGRADRRFHDRLTEAARLWGEAGCAEGRLWRPPDLDLLREYAARLGHELTAVQASFVSACERQQRLVRRTRWLAMTICMLLIFAAAGIYVIKQWQVARIEQQRAIDSQHFAEELHRRLLATYVEQGRQLLQKGDTMKALMWLHRAYEEGSRESGLRYLLAVAMRSIDNIRLALSEHQSSVNSVAYSHNGQLLASAGRDGIVYIWDAYSGKRLFTLAGHTASVSLVSFSPDGKMLASLADDHTARIWNPENGRLFTVLAGHYAALTGSAWNASGSLFATVAQDKLINLWDPKSGLRIAQLLGHTAGVRAVVFNPSGDRLVTGSDDRTARIWSVPKGNLLATLTGHADGIRAIVISPDGASLATTGFDRSIRLWDLRRAMLLSVLKGHEGGVWSIAYSPKGDLLASASEDQTARLWSTHSGAELAVLKGHSGAVRTVVFDRDGTRIATASADKSARVWTVAEASLQVALEGHGAGVQNISFSPDGTALATASGDRVVRVWNVGAPMRPAMQLEAPATIVQTVAISPDGSRILTASDDSTAHLWNIRGTRLATLDGHHGPIRSANFSRDGAFLVTASADATAKLWDATTGQQLATLSSHAMGLNSASFSPDAARIVTTSWDGSVRLWDARSGLPVAMLRGHAESVWSANYSSDGHYIVTTSSDKSARLWDAGSGALLAVLTGHRGTVWSAEFSPAGERVATASFDNTARVWSVPQGKLLQTLSGHTGSVTFITYSHDGRQLVTGSSDRTARIWDAASGKVLANLEGHEGRVSAAAFSRDNMLIATGAEDQAVRLWDRVSGRLLSAFDGHRGGIQALSYSADGALLSVSKEHTLRIWPLEPELRDAAILSRLLCRLVPYRFDGPALQPKMPGVERCP